jgi:hypothetical protein
MAADHLVTQRQLLESTGLSAQDLQILLTYMSATGKAATFETARGEKVSNKLDSLNRCAT